MPCYSRITATKIIDADTLAQALLELKIAILSKTQNLLRTSIGTFSRSSNGSAFTFEGDDVAQLEKVGVEYAARKAKDYMKRAGYSVLGDELRDGERRISLVKRG